MSGERRGLHVLLSLPAISLGIALMSRASSVTQSFHYARNIGSGRRNVLRVANEAATLAPAGCEALFAKVGASFAAANDDCAHAAHARLL